METVVETVVVKLFCIGAHVPEEAFTLIDAADAELVNEHTWMFSRNYAVKGAGRQERSLHGLLMGPPPASGLSIDHKNGVGTDNRRENLVWATKEQQTSNRRRRGRNRKSKDFWRGIFIDSEGLYHYNYDLHKGGGFEDAETCRQAMNTLAAM